MPFPDNADTWRKGATKTIRKPSSTVSGAVAGRRRSASRGGGRSPSVTGGAKKDPIAKTVKPSELVVKFIPRERHSQSTGGRRKVPKGYLWDSKNGKFLQGLAPKTKASTKTAQALNFTKACCLVHGMNPTFVPAAMVRGFLESAYNREGPKGKYGRDLDKNGGGALAVYTRAVGIDAGQWKAQGFGVGSGPDKVQLVISPTVLQRSGNVWRAAQQDGNGRVCGPVTATHIGDVNKGKIDTFDLWEMQSEFDRNNSFNKAVEAKGNGLQQNEQLHWESLPLSGTLVAIICQSDKNYKALTTALGRTKGITWDAAKQVATVGQHEVKIIRTSSGNDPLIEALKTSGVSVGALKATTTADNSDGGESQTKGPSNVALQQARLAWDTATKKVHREMDELKKAMPTVAKTNEEQKAVSKAIANLDEALKGFDARLVDKLDEALNAKTPDAGRQLLTESAAIVRGYRDLIATNPIIPSLDSNPVSPVTTYKTLTESLAALENKLGF